MKKQQLIEDIMVMHKEYTLAHLWNLTKKQLECLLLGKEKAPKINQSKKQKLYKVTALDGTPYGIFTSLYQISLEYGNSVSTIYKAFHEKRPFKCYEAMVVIEEVEE